MNTISTRRAVATGAHIVIGGDFNFPVMDWVNVRLKFTSRYPTLHHKFIDTIQDLGLEQMVTFPTRGENTLDLFLPNHPSLVPRVESMPELSDHDIPYMEFQTHPVHQKQTRRPVPQYNKADWPNLRRATKQLSDDIISKYNDKSDPEETKLDFTQHIENICAKANKTGLLEKELEGVLQPYQRAGLQSNGSSNCGIWRRRENPSEPSNAKFSADFEEPTGPTLKTGYLTAKKQSLERRKHSRHTKKASWTYIKSQCTEAASVSQLKVAGKLVSEAKDKAEVLNAQFQSAFSSKLSCSPEEVETWTGMSPEPKGPTCDHIHISVAGVRKLLKGLNPSKAPRPDRITPRLLKEIADEIAPGLTLLFQSPINTGIVPKDWKRANVLPVFKKGERYRPENYRPISLTSVPCKILEHIVVSTIMGFAEANNILREEQHSFRRSRSCESQLLGLADELSYNMEKGKQSDVLEMDFSKAFAKDYHSLLIHKLRHYGITGQVHEWIKNFLAN
ncbi:uncharacterized protein LOC143285011 [Babylonia areolata]|uniref:uncharacterized protein LOC143285011 n=1 Tax=Babylonia areolata TaxID=304850 RepID=UPI003FD6527A